MAEIDEGWGGSGGMTRGSSRLPDYDPKARVASGRGYRDAVVAQAVPVKNSIGLP